MKKYIILGLLMSVSLSVSARMYSVGEKIYVNVVQNDKRGDWSQANAKLFIVLYQSTDKNNSEKWIHLTATSSGSKVFVGTLPSDIRAWYDQAYMVREDPNTLAIWDKSCEFYIPDNYHPETGDGLHANCLNTFYAKNNVSDNCDGIQSYDWKCYAPEASLIPSVSSLISNGVNREDIQICSSALGGPFSLRVKLNASKTAYDYSIVEGHGWYVSTNSTSWSAIEDGKTGVIMSGIDDKIDLNEYQLPASIPAGGIYYYLHSNILAGRRLIHITADAPKCDLDCEITSFETAISAVNADDNTYTLDGMVAFGKANGNLIISCDGRDTIIKNPVSPQVFSLHGVPAATENGKTTTAEAYFQGDQTHCSKTISVNVPNATEAVQTVTKEELTGKNIVLTPKDTVDGYAFVWLHKNAKTGKLDTIVQGTRGKQLAISPYDKDSTDTYVFKEYYPSEGNMDDLMANGGYEDAGWDYGTKGAMSTISDYNYWGSYPETSTTQLNFYSNPTVNTGDWHDNGFAVVQNAYHFAPSFAKVKAKEGSNFALIDAASDGVADKRGWYATTAKHPKLKLKKGTTYVLSFWAANINNYGEMDNAARFQFRIKYNSKTWNSKVLDLGSAEFRNNIWHQCSQTFLADEDCDNVIISVVNLNTNKLNTGNDFALDDIQFHPISSVSKVVKSQQQFVVNAHEPKINAFTPTVEPIVCEGGTSYRVRMQVEYENPSGQLVIRDLQDNMDYAYTLPSVAYDTPASLDETIVVTSLNPEKRYWLVSFPDWPTAQLTAFTLAPGQPELPEPLTYTFSEPGCTDLTTTLTFDLDYRYQQGTLTYWVDNLPKQTATYLEKDTFMRQLTGLTVADIPADGKSNHELHVEFSEANSCRKTFQLPQVPFSPVISSVAVNVPASLTCDQVAYPVTVEAVTPYDATGRDIIFSYEDNGAKHDTTLAATGTKTSCTLTMHTLGATGQTMKAAYALTPTCVTTSSLFNTPSQPECGKWRDTICVGEDYSLHGFSLIAPAVGIHVVANGNDSLWLVVQDKPMIALASVATTCDDRKEVRFPYTVTNGNPDLFTLTLDEKDYSLTADAGDLVLTLTTPLPAGDYTATITLGTTGMNCNSTVSTTFSIALSGVMYRKWNDVIFISNVDGRFIAYQWYEKGKAIPGETQQRLYNPNGLPGTYTCELTTSDNKILYTCEQAFEDIQRSREVSNDSPQQVISTYRLSPHVYIIRSQRGDEIITRKEVRFE